MSVNSQPRRTSASKRKAVEKPRTPEERYPELLDLPFVKYLEGPPGARQCDWWAPEPPKEGLDSLEAEFLGEYYALLTLKHIADVVAPGIGRGRAGTSRVLPLSLSQ
jgi:hypothetical protein